MADENTVLVDRHLGRVGLDFAFVKALAGRSVIKELTGNYDLNNEERAVIYYLHPNGTARNVVLPTAAKSKNRVIIVANTATAAEIITLREGSVAGASRAAVGQDEMALMVCNGTRWFSMVGGNA